MLVKAPPSAIVIPQTSIKYLTEEQVNSLTAEFQDWYASTNGKKRRMQRGRYFLVYITLRFTGARLGEVLMIDDTADIDYWNSEIKIHTLKRKGWPVRVVPVPPSVTAAIGTYIAEFPEMRGKVFKVEARNFRRIFSQLALKAGIPRDLAHPHVLRHTRAVELLRAGIPITVVQDLLGHAYLSTTAVYLRLSGQEAKRMLKERGLI